MAGRTIAIGDIHGCRPALAALIDAIRIQTGDTVMTLGDHIDRGADSRGVLSLLIDLEKRCRLIPLLGNHEEMMVDALRDSGNLSKWLAGGGSDTLRSYGWAPGGPKRTLASWIPEMHRKFIDRCLPYYETATHIFIHGGYIADLPMDQQPKLALQWRVTDAATALPHCSGKTAIVGHTPQTNGEILDLGFLICIDTNCARGGWLTALDVDQGHVWQANSAGVLRRL